MKCFILHLPLFIFFLAGSARADGGDVLDRIVRLPGMKGTVYAPVSYTHLTLPTNSLV